MSDIFERVLLLKKSPIFSAVNTEDLRVVAQTMEEEVYFKGDRVFDINDQGDHMYILLNGRVGISISQELNGKEYVAELTSGECFGEMGILDSKPRSATVYVLEDACMLTLEKARLNALIQHYPALALGMLRGLSTKLRTVNEILNQ